MYVMILVFRVINVRVCNSAFTKTLKIVTTNDYMFCSMRDYQHNVNEFNMGIFVFKEGVWGNFFRFTLKAFLSIRVTLGIIQNDYFDHVRHV